MCCLFITDIDELAGIRICTPLLTRVIIQQLTEAHDFHQAVVAGESTVGLPIPKPIGYGIGLAFAYFALQIISGIILYLEIQIATVLGCTTKAAVRRHWILVLADLAIDHKRDRKEGNVRHASLQHEKETLIGSGASRQSHDLT